MDILNWLIPVLRQAVPASVFGSIMAAGAIVATIVCAIKAIWIRRTEAQTLALVVVVSAALNAVILVQARIPLQLLTFLLAVAVTAASAVFEHEALAKAGTSSTAKALIAGVRGRPP